MKLLEGINDFLKIKFAQDIMSISNNPSYNGN